MSLPTITICGNMKRIELKYTQSGKAVCSFQVECSEKNAKGEYQNLYIKGECWERQAEFVNQYFREGSVAIVTGKLFTNVYEKQDGTKVYENKLLFPNVSFAPKDKAESNNGQANQSPQQGGYSGNQQQSQQSYQANQTQQPYQAQQSHTDYREPQKQMPSSDSVPSIDIDMEQVPF